jgi:hypothetical protein
MSGFTKLYSTILLSTVWREPAHSRLTWITMLALADARGHVEASIPGLADAARVTIAECEEALRSFMSPDPYSRTTDHEGRRIERIDGGWRLLNHAKYREPRDPERRRDQNREAQARWRERQPRKRRDSKAVSIAFCVALREVLASFGFEVSRLQSCLDSFLRGLAGPVHSRAAAGRIASGAISHPSTSIVYSAA